MIQTETKEINGRTWQCTQWSGSKNLRHFHELSSMLAPSIAAAAPDGRLSANADIAGAVDKLFRGLGTSEHVLELVLRLLAGVHIDGRAINKQEFDTAFVGPRIRDLVPGLIFVLETNYGDFSGLLRDIIARSAAQQDQQEDPAATVSTSD